MTKPAHSDEEYAKLIAENQRLREANRLLTLFIEGPPAKKNVEKHD
jgi:hypothetical protein